MKKFLILLVMILTLSLCACGSSAGSDSGDDTPPYVGNWLVYQIHNSEEGTMLKVSDLTDQEMIDLFTMDLTIKEDGTWYEVVGDGVYRGDYDVSDDSDNEMLTLYCDGDPLKYLIYDSKSNELVYIPAESAQLTYYYEKK